MNTPSTKPISRVARKRSFPARKPPRDGWTEGIHNARFAELVGQIITSLPLIEEKMIRFLSRLLGYPGTGDDPARQIFRTIESQRARINLMQALLQNAHINHSKPAKFDAVVALFKSVKDRRDDLAHGLWYTHESGRVFLAKASNDMGLLLPSMRREVSINELNCDVERMRELTRKIDDAVGWVDPNPLKPGWVRFRLTSNKAKSEPAAD
jgi:hypothetical protein